MDNISRALKCSWPIHCMVSGGGAQGLSEILPHSPNDPFRRNMSRYTVFLPAPSFSDLKRDVRRTWVVKEHDLDIPDHNPGTHLSNPDMEIDEISLKDAGERASLERHSSTTPLKSLKTPGMREEESMGDASALLFSQPLSNLYDGAVLRDDDLDEQYAFSQLDEISRDSGELFGTYHMYLLSHSSKN
jgi:hypothetical protein